MFMTQQHAEKLLGRPFGGERYWRLVELSSDAPWFYVNVAFSHVQGKGHRHYLFTEASDLVRLIDETSECFWIEQVMLVIPPQMNGTERWEMHQLEELIAVGDSADLLHIDYIYKLKNDLLYSTTDGSGVCERRLHQTLFSQQ
ncbi:hypothetical protein [Hydrocarboniclastica marina]|uniref:Uncharacterized protein n=1 Tax=Hydrocarboniclastica marina TaxID=2259620 RepID=A0A4P7XKP1_9ALTE|nr:hypothetical protein [Hydrocarboniclastica marina]MAL97745.1 hypothetical protein [Alteromonadaceae bacterium]QCF26497.1 hypothetical protein soil367_11420 [Hydrocarboniclastica marina]|tara:strand:- start:4359 stop:4787 length:429 start_codon:yes stop_codon:yes gene_type:complete